MIKIEKVEGGYVARATPPHVQQQYWSSTAPLSVDELIKVMRDLGMHTTDISDAFYEADPDWLTR